MCSEGLGALGPQEVRGREADRGRSPGPGRGDCQRVCSTRWLDLKQAPGAPGGSTPLQHLELDIANPGGWCDILSSASSRSWGDRGAAGVPVEGTGTRISGRARKHQEGGY